MCHRIMTSQSFNGDRILGAILFENTIEHKVNGKPTAEYLWNEKNVVPFLKVDKGLAAEANGVQIMKPILTLDKLLRNQKGKGCWMLWYQMRSVIKLADVDGIKANVNQQFENGKQIIQAGLVPIIIWVWDLCRGTMYGTREQINKGGKSPPYLLLTFQ